MPVAALSLIPAAAGLISSGINAISAGSQERKDKRALSSLNAPFYKIQQEYGDIEHSAAEEAQGGLSQGSLDYYSDQTGRGLGTAISGVQATGGGPNDIQRIFEGYNDSVKNVSAADADAHIKNIQYYNNAAKDVAAQKNIQFGVNEYQPYQEKLKQLTDNIAADKLNLHNSINSGISDVQAGVTGFSNATLTDKLFSSGSGKASDPFETPSNNTAPQGGGMGGLTPGQMQKLLTLLQ